MQLLAILGCLALVGPASMDAYLPALPDLAGDFHSSTSSAQLTLTTYLSGIALGQLLAGTLSDTKGRRPPLIGGMMLYAVTSVACSLAPSLPILTSLRFVQGMAAAAGMAVSRAIVRDLYSGASAARYLSRLMLIVGIGPILAPIVGAQILRVASWRGIFAALAIFGVVLALTAACFLPETLPRERRHSPGIGVGVRNYMRLLNDSAFRRFALIIGLGAGAMTAYISGSSFVLERVYGASPQLYSVLFGISAFCLMIGAHINAHFLATQPPAAMLRAGLTLLLLAATVLLLAIALHRGGLAAVLPPLALMMFSWSFILSNAFALALTNYAAFAGAAAAALGVTQFLFSASIAPLVGAGGEMNALPMAIVIAACAMGARLAFRAPAVSVVGEEVVAGTSLGPVP